MRHLAGVPVPDTLGQWLAVGAGLAVFGYVGWDSALWDARFQLLLHLLAVGAIGGLAVFWLRGGLLPRTPLDVPVLGLLGAFALATASALNVGMSLRAMAAIVAFAAMLPIAILAIRHRPTWVGIVTAVPVLALSVPTLVVLLSRRLDWILAGAPGLPPLRMRAEGTPFGSVAVPPFVIIPAWALAGLIEPAWLRRSVRAGLVAVGIPMTILSGSRSAWLAIAAAAVVGLAPIAWRQRHRLRVPRRVGWRSAVVGIGALGLVALAVALVVPRVTAVTSLLYRAALWRDTLNAWQSDPLLGIGPGFMPFARQAFADPGTFPVRQPHSHNLPLAVLGDAGIVGLLAAGVVVVTLVLVAAPWRCRTAVGRSASVVLIGLGVGGLFEDLTFVPGFVLLAVALVALVLLDAGAVRWWRPPPVAAWPMRGRALLGAGGLAAAVLLAAMVTSDAGAIAYRAGIDAGAGDRWDEATERLTRATEIDPWHPAGFASLTVAADAAGRPELARDAAERAVALNPGDAVSWTNLSLVCRGLGDRDCQVGAAERAVETARYGAIELLNAAVSLGSAGAEESAERAYRRSLLTQPQTAFVLPWLSPIEIGDGTIPDYSDPSWQLNRLIALHATDEPIHPDEFADPSVRALAHAAIGERDAAERALAEAVDAAPEERMTWDVAIVLRSAWGEPIDEELAIAAVVRGRAFPTSDLVVPIPDRALDIGSFRAYPRDGFVRDAIRTQTVPGYPWVLDALLP